MNLPSKDEFEVWRTDYTTKLVFEALARLEEKAKDHWLETSWDGGNADEALLIDLRARVEVIKDLRELSHEDLEEILSNEEPERDYPD